MKKSRRPLLARQGQFARRFMAGLPPPLDPVGLTGLTSSEWKWMMRALAQQEKNGREQAE